MGNRRKWAVGIGSEAAVSWPLENIMESDGHAVAGFHLGFLPLGKVMRLESVRE